MHFDLQAIISCKNVEKFSKIKFKSEFWQKLLFYTILRLDSDGFNQNISDLLLIETEMFSAWKFQWKMLMKQTDLPLLNFRLEQSKIFNEIIQ